MYIRTSTQACSYCIVTDGPSPLNSSWDLVGVGCCQGLWGEEEGEERSGRSSFVGRLKEKERTSTCQLHIETFISMSSIWPSIPFCFNLKFCHDNTAVTNPNTATMATNSATKEAVVEMRTPEEGGTVSPNSLRSHTHTVRSIQFDAWDDASLYCEHVFHDLSNLPSL